MGHGIIKMTNPAISSSRGMFQRVVGQTPEKPFPPVSSDTMDCFSGCVAWVVRPSNHLLARLTLGYYIGPIYIAGPINLFTAHENYVVYLYTNIVLWWIVRFGGYGDDKGWAINHEDLILWLIDESPYEKAAVMKYLYFAPKTCRGSFR